MKRDGALKVLKTATLIYCTEDGQMETRRQKIYVDPRGSVSFVISLPEYVTAALGCGTEVRSDRGDNIGRLFEEKMREYSQWYKTRKAEPVIVLRVKYAIHDRRPKAPEDGRLWPDMDEGSMVFFADDRNDTEMISGVLVQYSLMFRINGKIHHRTKDKKTGEYVPGYQVNGHSGTVLDYTPALHAKIDKICEAIFNAATVMHEIIQSKDVAKALLSFTTPRLTGPKS